MASMRDIKRRKNSVTSTQQITKAMKLVSTVKLQKAKARAEKTVGHPLDAKVTFVLPEKEADEFSKLTSNLQ